MRKCNVLVDCTEIVAGPGEKTIPCNVCNGTIAKAYTVIKTRIMRLQTPNDMCGCYSSTKPSVPLHVNECGDCAKEYLQEPKAMIVDLRIYVCSICYSQSLMLQNM